MKKVAIQADPLATLNIEGDSTFALALEAQARSLEVWFYQPENLFVRDGSVYTKAQAASLRDDKTNPATLQPLKTVDLADFDVVLMRQDPPFNMHYITATYFLDLIAPSTLVANNPTSVRTYPEKILPLYFKELMPSTLISTSAEEIKDFRNALSGAMILKPLYGNGGKGIHLIEKDNKNIDELIEKMLPAFEGAPLIAQAFIEKVVEGDKRIILIDGEPVAALNRVPAAGDIRANLGAGASAHLCELTAKEKEICAQLKPMLCEGGILFAGIDVIDGALTEINITSPTGIRQVRALGGVDVAALFWDKVQARL